MSTEKRLIDANDAEKFAREHILDAKERFLILDFLRDCSTVDAPEVVRCKDFKHCCLDLSGRENHLCMRKANDFCSYGERKNDG